MFGLIRNLVIILVLLTAVYAVLSFLSRRRARDRIAGEYTQSETDMPKEDFIDTGLRKYQRSYRPKLIIGVYLIPLMVASLLIYLANYT